MHTRYPNFGRLLTRKL